MRGRARLALALLTLLAAPARAADLRVSEAVGAVPLHADARPTSPPRDAAERKAMAEAVRRVALQMLTDQDPAEVEPRLDAALGPDPMVYISRFRTLEDRGERPALFSDDPEARTEYVVVVEVQVDAGRVREALARSGLLVTPAGEERRFRVRLEAEGLTDYASYRALRETLIEGVGVRSALPVEMERGRAAFDVESELAGDALVAALVQSAPPGLTLTPLETSPERVLLRVQLTPESVPGGIPAPAIDTTNPNRY
ncbi:MAG TPA: hypothetical protein VII72_22265 [Myxococcota bacterium]